MIQLGPVVDDLAKAKWELKTPPPAFILKTPLRKEDKRKKLTQ